MACRLITPHPWLLNWRNWQASRPARSMGGMSQGRAVPCFLWQATDLRYNPIGERVSGAIRERVNPRLEGVGVPEPQLHGALVSVIAGFEVLSGGKVGGSVRQTKIPGCVAAGVVDQGAGVVQALGVGWEGRT